MEVLVLMDFQGTMEDEINLQVGDVVKNVSKAREEGWLLGDLRGKRGIFPANFVKEIPVYLIGNDKREPRSLRKSKLTKKQTRRCEVAFAYSPLNEDELELQLGETIEVLKEIEDGWWMGLKNGKIGAFPSNFVKEIFTPKDAKLNEGKNRPRLSEAIFTKETKEQHKTSVRKKNNYVKECCQAMFDYTAVIDDELDLKKGDIVTVISKETEDEGWWEGELRGQRGFFPDNFVMVIPTDALQPGTPSQPPARRGTEQPPVSVPPPERLLRVAGRQQVQTEASAMEKTTFEHGSTDPVSKGERKDEKADTKDLRSDVPSKLKLPGLRKAPPPPVKDKPQKFVPNRSNGDLPPLSPKQTEDKSQEKDLDQFDEVDVSTEKLTHPTASRAKPPHRRPPSSLFTTPHAPGSTDLKEGSGETEMPPKKFPGVSKVTETRLLSPTHSEPPTQLPKVPMVLKPLAPKGPAEAKPSPKPAQGEHVSTEQLLAEVRELSMALELLKTRHKSDIEELREELKEEQAKRTALLEEVRLLKKAVTHH